MVLDVSTSFPLDFDISYQKLLELFQLIIQVEDFAVSYAREVGNLCTLAPSKFVVCIYVLYFCLGLSLGIRLSL